MAPPSPKDNCDSEALAKVVTKHPEQFAFLAGGGTLNPMIQQAIRSGQVTPQMLRLFEERALQILDDGAVGFGEMTAEHFSHFARHPYEVAPPDHPLFLLLADIAGRNKVPIDLHMEVIPEDMPFSAISPTVYSRIRWSPNNPSMLYENLQAFERLLAHNRNAPIIWAHVGSDQTGFLTIELMNRLLQDHPNLYMQIRLGFGGHPPNRPIGNDGRIRPEWLELIASFPDRFVFGLDSFYAPPEHTRFPSRPERLFRAYSHFLNQLPLDLARKVAYENAARIYALK